MEDVKALNEILKLMRPSLSILSNFSCSLESVLTMFKFKANSKILFETLNPLLETKSISKGIANKIANSGFALSHLQLAIRRDGQQELNSLLSETCEGSKV